MGRTIGANAVNDFSLITGSKISLSQLFANVNTGDNKFLKYIPDKFLSEEQVAAKRTAQEADYTKYGRYKEVFEGKSEQKFSLSDPLNAAFNQDVQDKFEKDVDDVLNGKYTSDDPLMLGTTPTVFRQIGLSALPVVITKNHVYSIASTEAQAKADGRYSKKVNYHGLGAQTVKQIYSKISNPLAIIAAQDITVSPGVYSTHRVVAIVDLSINGKQVIAPVEVDADVFMNNKALDVNLVATYYDRSNIASMLRNAVSSEQSGGVGFYYIDKKRAANLLKPTGVQFPSTLVANNSNGIIHQVDEKVNRKIDTVLKSRQFIRWFGDWQNSPETASKVVNEDGTPKAMYHQTGASFTVFNTNSEAAGFPKLL